MNWGLRRLISLLLVLALAVESAPSFASVTSVPGSSPVRSCLFEGQAIPAVLRHFSHGPEGKTAAIGQSQAESAQVLAIAQGHWWTRLYIAARKAEQGNKRAWLRLESDPLFPQKLGKEWTDLLGMAVDGQFKELAEYIALTIAPREEALYYFVEPIREQFRRPPGAVIVSFEDFGHFLFELVDVMISDHPYGFFGASVIGRKLSDEKRADLFAKAVTWLAPALEAYEHDGTVAEILEAAYNSRDPHSTYNAAVLRGEKPGEPLAMGWNDQYSWTSDAQGLENVRQILRQERPDLLRTYAHWNFLNEPQRNRFRAAVYALTEARFRHWRLSSALTRSAAPYFQASYVVILQKLFPQAELNPLGFKKQWDTPEKAMESLRYAFATERPDLWKAYLKWEDLGDDQRRNFRIQVYQITNEHFKQWGIKAATHSIKVPFFKGSYIVALQQLLPKAELNRLGFQPDWTTPELGIASVFYRFELHYPDLIAQYRAWDTLTRKQRRDIQSALYTLRNNDFRKMQLSGGLTSRLAPDFAGSYIVMLQKVFPKAGLVTAGFGVYDWSTETSAIKSIRDRITIVAPDLWQKYQRWSHVTPEQRSDLHREISRISLRQIRAWGLSALKNRRETPYFLGSHKTALEKVFPEVFAENPIGGWRPAGIAQGHWWTETFAEALHNNDTALIEEIATVIAPKEETYFYFIQPILSAIENGLLFFKDAQDAAMFVETLISKFVDAHEVAYFPGSPATRSLTETEKAALRIEVRRWTEPLFTLLKGPLSFDQPAFMDRLMEAADFMIAEHAAYNTAVLKGKKPGARMIRRGGDLEAIDANGDLLWARIRTAEGGIISIQRDARPNIAYKEPLNDGQHGSVYHFTIWKDDVRIDGFHESGNDEKPSLTWHEIRDASGQPLKLELQGVFLRNQYKNSGVGTAIFRWLGERAAEQRYPEYGINRTDNAVVLKTFPRVLKLSTERFEIWREDATGGSRLNGQVGLWDPVTRNQLLLKTRTMWFRDADRKYFNVSPGPDGTWTVDGPYTVKITNDTDLTLLGNDGRPAPYPVHMREEIRITGQPKAGPSSIEIPLPLAMAMAQSKEPLDPEKILEITNSIKAEGRIPYKEEVCKKLGITRSALIHRAKKQAIDLGALGIAVAGANDPAPVHKKYTRNTYGYDTVTQKWVFLKNGSVTRREQSEWVKKGYTTIRIEDVRLNSTGGIKILGLTNTSWFGPKYKDQPIDLLLTWSPVAFHYVILQADMPHPGHETIYFKQVFGRKNSTSDIQRIDSFYEQSPEDGGQSWKKKGFDEIIIKGVKTVKNGYFSVLGQNGVARLGFDFENQLIDVHLLWSDVMKRFVVTGFKLHAQNSGFIPFKTVWTIKHGLQSNKIIDSYYGTSPYHRGLAWRDSNIFQIIIKDVDLDQNGSMTFLGQRPWETRNEALGHGSADVVLSWSESARQYLPFVARMRSKKLDKQHVVWFTVTSDPPDKGKPFIWPPIPHAAFHGITRWNWIKTRSNIQEGQMAWIPWTKIVDNRYASPTTTAEYIFRSAKEDMPVYSAYRRLVNEYKFIGVVIGNAVILAKDLVWRPFEETPVSNLAKGIRVLHRYMGEEGVLLGFDDKHISVRINGNGEYLLKRPTHDIEVVGEAGLHSDLKESDLKDRKITIEPKANQALRSAA